MLYLISEIVFYAAIILLWGVMPLIGVCLMIKSDGTGIARKL